MVRARWTDTVPPAHPVPGSSSCPEAPARDRNPAQDYRNPKHPPQNQFQDQPSPQRSIARHRRPSWVSESRGLISPPQSLRTTLWFGSLCDGGDVDSDGNWHSPKIPDIAEELRETQDELISNFARFVEISNRTSLELYLQPTRQCYCHRTRWDIIDRKRNGPASIRSGNIPSCCWEKFLARCHSVALFVLTRYYERETNWPTAVLKGVFESCDDQGGELHIYVMDDMPSASGDGTLWNPE